MLLNSRWSVRRLAGGASLLALILLQPSCDMALEDTERTPEGNIQWRGEVASSRLDDAALWQALAPGIAKVLGNPRTRAALLGSWRASPLTEHKLEFPAFAATAEGAALIRSAAAVLELDSDAMLAEVLASKAVDFYLPNQEHRRYWRGTDDVVVATNFRGSLGPGFTVRGVRVPLDGRALNLPMRPVAMIQPAELKLRRHDAEARRGGETVQDPDEESIQVEIVEISGEGTRRDQGVSFAQCSEDTCGGGGGGGGSGSGSQAKKTYLTRIQTVGICDNNNCDEGNEFELDAVVAATGARSRLRITGIASSTNLTRNDLLIGADPAFSGLIRVQVRETDNWGDDDWLEVRYQPNYAGPVELAASSLGRFVNLKENPHVGVFDPYRLFLLFEAR